MKTAPKTLLFILLILFGGSASGQNVEQVAQATPLSLSGNLRFGFNYFDNGAEDPARLPFSYVITGAPTLSVFGFDIPVTISYRDGQVGTAARSPFNRYGISPSYKWVKLHLGQSFLRLAPYTLSGRNVNGVGMELTPGKFRIAAIKGTLDNYALLPDSLSFLNTIVPVYERQALGGTFGFSGQSTDIDISFLKVKDDVQRMADPVDSLLLVRPEENLVGELDWSWRFLKRWSLDVHAAGSIHTPNTEAAPLANFGEFEPGKAVDQVAGILSPNLTTRWGLAGDASLNVRLKNGQMGLKYRRVDPFFQSLGINYLQRDLQDVTGNLDVSLLKRRLRIQVSGGIQSNNLSGFKATGARRIIASASAQYRPNKQWLLALRYSNYQRETTPGLLELNDTLRQVNVSRSAGFNTAYTVKKASNTLVFSLSGSFQEVNDLHHFENLSTDVQTFNIGFSPSLRFSNGLRIGPSLRYNQTQSGELNQQRLIGGFQLSHRLLDKKLNLRLSANYGLLRRDQQKNGSSWQSRLNIRYRIRSNMSAYVRAGYASRQSLGLDVRTQLRLSGGYQVSF